ncbi:SCO6745 family protein [Umezawaea sp.]|uniref:SCO6745 family protein n=1 Tax=Umezawaea sp. TaxID=1955258 RepID=UPI002ED5C4FA
MRDDEGPALARHLWARYESVHALVYFHPTALAALEAVGLRGFWRGYFAQRAAPLGPVGEAVVRASFFGFSAAMTARALPAVWALASPAAALAARLDGAGRALAELLPDLDDRLADELWAVASALPCDGRVLAAANAAVPRPDDPRERLWQATAVLREHRGDGHVAALLAEGLTGIESLVLRTASDLDRRVTQAARGWTDEEWSAAAEGLLARGLLRAEDEIGDAGRALLARVERVTDDLAWDGWTRAGATVADARRLVRELRGPALTCQTALPATHPIGRLEITD